jgi:hypothetical protein
MKKRIIPGILLGLALASGLVACGAEKEDKQDDKVVDTTTTTSTSTSTSTDTSTSTSTSTTTNTSISTSTTTNTSTSTSTTTNTTTSTSTTTTTSTNTQTTTTSGQSGASLVKNYLQSLIQIENATAYDYLPAAMAPTYRANVVEDPSSINYDFTSFTNVSSLHHAGYGEQWQMVVENINQSVTMAKVFNVAQTALNTISSAVEAYIDNNYAPTMSHTFTGDNYNATFTLGSDKLSLNINFTSSVTVPVIGTVQPVIKMQYDLENDAKAMYISLGDAYKIKYIVSDNAYEMATTYGITIKGVSASRSSYLSVSQNNGKTTGHIYEYTSLNSSDKISACADFYVENNYVSVVGNKASGMVAFTGYVNELYKANEGILLGYEVRETLSAIQYDTLWFNLWDISGINNVKVTDKTDANESGKSTVDVYLNDSTTLFAPTYNTKAFVKTSRKYDIEYRSRFYYTYDSENQKYVANEVKVPMMFIQEDNSIDSNFTDYPKNMLDDNGITSSVILNQNDLNKVLADYDSYIPVFKENKESMSSDAIVNYLNQYED